MIRYLFIINFNAIIIPITLHPSGIIFRHGAPKRANIWSRLKACKTEVVSLCLEQTFFNFLHLRPLLLWIQYIIHLRPFNVSCHPLNIYLLWFLIWHRSLPHTPLSLNNTVMVDHHVASVAP